MGKPIRSNPLVVNSISIIRLSGGVVAESCWPAIRAICCRTGNNGEPIAEDRSEFFAKVWIEPYEKILPEAMDAWSVALAIETSSKQRSCSRASKYARRNKAGRFLPVKCSTKQLQQRFSRQDASEQIRNPNIESGPADRNKHRDE